MNEWPNMFFSFFFRFIHIHFPMIEIQWKKKLPFVTILHLNFIKLENRIFGALTFAVCPYYGYICTCCCLFNDDFVSSSLRHNKKFILNIDPNGLKWLASWIVRQCWLFPKTKHTNSNGWTLNAFDWFYSTNHHNSIRLKTTPVTQFYGKSVFFFSLLFFFLRLNRHECSVWYSILCWTDKRANGTIIFCFSSLRLNYFGFLWRWFEM